VSTKRFQLDLTEQEHDELENLMEAAGLKTKREMVSNALALYHWAATERLYGRGLASIDRDGRVIKQFEMPSLAAFARAGERLDAATPPASELRARAERGGRSAEDVLADLARRLEEWSHAQEGGAVLAGGR
jgi:hypothetical protein